MNPPLVKSYFKKYFMSGGFTFQSGGFKSHPP
jgi:hypothetical protein